MFVYDITNIKSFENIKKRIKNVDEVMVHVVSHVFLYHVGWHMLGFVSHVTVCRSQC
jgi:hypothetical protein